MKKLIVVLICIFTIFLTGCGKIFTVPNNGIIYDLSNFTMPNDSEFTTIVDSLDTPKKICTYMKENFKWQIHLWDSYSPYQMWLANTQTKAGDCNDMSCFAVFVANYHEYETYQIWVFFKGTNISHFLAVFVEDNRYTYSSNMYYHPIYADTFEEIVNDYFTYQTKELKSYKVYDYNNNLIEKGKQ